MGLELGYPQRAAGEVTVNTDSNPRIGRLRRSAAPASRQLRGAETKGLLSVDVSSLQEEVAVAVAAARYTARAGASPIAPGGRVSGKTQEPLSSTIANSLVRGETCNKYPLATANLPQVFQALPMLEGSKSLELNEPLCCCEYVNRHGERSHLAACCCDCEDLDQACDRWLKREPQKPDSLAHVTATVKDRLRIPWFSGAKQVDLSVVPPLILLPVLLQVAALHFLLGVVILTALPGLVLWYYYVTHRRKGRTLFFLSLALFSLAYMYYLFLTEVLPHGDVDMAQLVAVTTGVALTLLSLANTKKGPGYVRPHPADTHSTVMYHGKLPDQDFVPSNGTSQQVVIANRASALGQAAQGSVLQDNSVRKNWCHMCGIMRPPRSGHCRICSACVYRMDHHCVWINSCVGQANHRSFLLTLLLFLLTSLYGISLVLRSVCPRQNPLFALFYCPGVYNQYSTALCFTCAWYSSVVTGGLLHLLVLQLINISYNVTEREARLALREKVGRSRLWGLIVDTGIYSRGFRSNWVEFLTMDVVPKPVSFSLPDLV
ncbi:palmitoyltransferase ZDHHC23 [Arapaima gigas]